MSSYFKLFGYSFAGWGLIFLKAQVDNTQVVNTQADKVQHPTDLRAVSTEQQIDDQPKENQQQTDDQQPQQEQEQPEEEQEQQDEQTEKKPEQQPNQPEQQENTTIQIKPELQQELKSSCKTGEIYSVPTDNTREELNEQITKFKYEPIKVTPNEIIIWITNNIILKNKLFEELQVLPINNYIQITRKGISPTNIITNTLIPNLTYLLWQYKIPIDYKTLKYLLRHKNKSYNDEIIQILSQEYLIALQPSPEYQMSCLNKLIMCWYANTTLENNIRKIKVLTNFDKTLTVQPTILIYPLYGKESFKLVMNLIQEYFKDYEDEMPYTWTCNKPTYFNKINNFMWYTNGTLNLKAYKEQGMIATT